MGILIVLGLLLAALGAVYRFIVENAAAIAVFGVVAGSLLLLAYFFSKIGRRKTAAASAPPALPRSATKLAPGPTTPQVEARDHFGFRQAPTAGPASNLTQLVAKDPKNVKIKFRALYTGLSGRVLRAWGNPLSNLMMEGGAARSDEAMLEATIPAAEIETNLARWLHPLVASLYERFGVTGLSVDRVKSELERMRASKRKFRNS